MPRCFKSAPWRVLVPMVACALMGSCKTKSNSAAEVQSIGTGSLYERDGYFDLSESYQGINFYRSGVAAGQDYIFELGCQNRRLSYAKDSPDTKQIGSSLIYVDQDWKELQSKCGRYYITRMPRATAIAFVKDQFLERTMWMSKPDLSGAKLGSQDWIEAVEAAWQQLVNVEEASINGVEVDRFKKWVASYKEELAAAAALVKDLEAAAASLDERAEPARPFIEKDLAEARKKHEAAQSGLKKSEDLLAKAVQTTKIVRGDIKRGFEEFEAILRDEGRSLIAHNGYYSQPDSGAAPGNPVDYPYGVRLILSSLSGSLDDAFRWHISTLRDPDDFVTLAEIRRNAPTVRTSSGTFRPYGTNKPFSVSHGEASGEVRSTQFQSSRNPSPTISCQAMFGAGYKLPSYKELKQNKHDLLASSLPSYFGEQRIWTADTWTAGGSVSYLYSYAVKLESGFLSALDYESMVLSERQVAVLCYKPD